MKIATVGLPCQIEALRKLELYKDEEEFSWIKNVHLKIGLFCRENWMYGCFRALVEDDFGIKLEEIDKFRIRKKKIQALRNKEIVKEIPLEKAKPYIRVACFVCLDFSSELADISIGAVGAYKKGYNIVIVRNKKGKDIVNGAIEAGYLERVNEIKRKPFLIVAKDKFESNLKEIKYREMSGYHVNYVKTFELSYKDVYEQSKTKTFDDLKREVVEEGNCTSCGNCVAVCKNLIMKDAYPEKVEECDEKCYICYLSCPRTFLPKNEIKKLVYTGENMKFEEFFGGYLEIFSARAKDEKIRKLAQDGGTTTALLSYCLDYNIVDVVINATKDKNWEPRVMICKSSDDLLKTTKTIYSYLILSPHIKSYIRGEKID